MAHSSPRADSASPRVSTSNSGPNSPVVPGIREWTQSKATHLPFRRISLTPAPTQTLFGSSASSHRVSVASAGSFESMPEDETMSPPYTPSSDKRSAPPSRGTSRFSERPKMHRRPSSSGSISSIELGNKMRLSANLRPSRSQRSRIKIPAPNKTPLEDAHNAKRLKVMQEFWETERAYVDGLELVYSHFLTPLISSLSEPTPLLSRADLTTLFSNFVDIWNLNHSLLSHLDEFFLRTTSATASSPFPKGAADEPLTSEPSSRSSTRPPSFMSTVSSAESHHPANIQHHHAINDFLRILSSHFPYLSMYNPFVTAFPASLSLLTALSTPPPNNLQSSFPRPSTTTGPGVRSYEPRFAAWLQDKEADPICRRLKLRDWMLTVIQRCPRYLLLIKELLGYTSVQDPEYRLLLEVTDLITKITNTLNQSLVVHAQIMSLISLQRSTPNLPFSLIVPGRTLLRRSTMIKVDRGSDRRLRDLLLFSDCLIWISRGGEREDWGVLGEWANAGLETGQSVFRESLVLDGSQNLIARSRRQSHGPWLGIGQGAPPPTAHGIRLTGRTRSRSDADALPVAIRPSSSVTNLLPSPDPSLLRSSAPGRDDGAEEKWWYRGRAELLDIEIVVPPIISAPGEERMLEVMSPEGSFALYSESQAERDAWVHAIRAAKAARLASFQVTHPDTTLTSSNSNAHLRRSLQALPHDPAEETPPSSPNDATASPSSPKKSRKASKTGVRRAKVEHFVPAIWVPDQKTDTCMRCNSRFGWRRRRHHCRLCGRVVCASCSEKTFYITDANDASSSSTPARACNACFESVFPIVPSNGEEVGTLKASVSLSPQALKKTIPVDMRPTISLPTLALATPPLTTPSIAMANSKPSFGSRIRGASFLRGKRTSREKPPGDNATSDKSSSLSRTRSATSTISSSSGFPNDSGTASLSTTDEGSNWLSSTGGSSAAAFPDSFATASPTTMNKPNKVTFPAIDSFPTSSTVLAGNDAFMPSTPMIEQHSITIGQDENGTVGPRRTNHARLPVREMPFDPEVTPRPTARKQDRPWSCGDVPRPSLPMPDFDLASPGKPSAVAGTSYGEDLDVVIADVMHLPDGLVADETVRALSPRIRRSSLQVLQDARAPPRGYKKRVSIAPFPIPAPQALLIHDAPVTARTRVQGDGSSRRYSLVLGGTMRKPPPPDSAQDLVQSNGGVGAMSEVEPAVLVVSQGKLSGGARNTEDARQATRGDVDAPSSRSYSLRNGVAITKLAELLGRDRHHGSR